MSVTRPRVLSLGALSAAALGLLLWAGCANDKKNPVSPSAGTPTMSGAFVSGSVSGPLALYLGTAGTPVAASALIRPNGGSIVSLSGTYNPETDSLALSGSGYTFLGRADTTGIVPAIFGSWTGNGGPGAFLCAEGTAQNPVASYCALYTSGIGPGTGNWLMLAVGDQLIAVAYPQGGGEPIGMDGVISGSAPTRTITLGGTAAAGDTITAVGTLDESGAATTVYGAYQIKNGASSVDTGIWQGGPCL